MSRVAISWKDAISGFKPIGAHVNDTDISSADALSPASGATKLMIQASDADVRFTLDGTTPTAAVGFTLVAGLGPVIILLEAGVTVTVIEEGTGAILDYQWGN
jgi:hypothetical protein